MLFHLQDRVAHFVRNPAPYQQTNRYAVVGIREFLLSQTRVSFICFPTRKDTLQMIKGRETYAQKTHYAPRKGSVGQLHTQLYRCSYQHRAFRFLHA
ncbi:hypothetical protein HMPREF1991_01825 [Hoylesella loescheii DSM 19665 = JCM 12249 = ATCC 15930]|uniref:Uncharacterized protein n=1 Tax=Hoylesella loescheii DSM 19665 = JCM 12249 = ATCC 15930 TaxID=1122985 RepID=A0A069QQM2_HOYLO|nr:hypothetical protein HMPREF1991_01825 [Hoylesella loescheii DSM 19665 = JCM 12249 = ATCC 15930]